MLAEPQQDPTKPSAAVERGLVEELRAFASALPHKAVFVVMLLAWVALFHFLGNSVLGYIQTRSIFGWLKYYGESTDDNLGVFVPVAVVALLWWKRDELVAVRKGVWWPALFLFILGVLLHVIGYTVQQTRLSVAGFFIGLYALTGLLWGWRWMRATFFPFVLFVFMMPPTSEVEGLTLPLRQLATTITVTIAHGLLGICVVQEGTLMKDCAGHFQYNVEAACSGLRSLTTMLALGTVFAFISFRSNWKRALLIFSAVPLAVCGNVIRLLSIVVAANWKYDQMMHAQNSTLAAEQAAQAFGGFVHEHSILKMLPYIPAFVGMLLLARWLPEDARKEENEKGTMALRPAWIPAIVTLVLMAGAASLLATQHSRQKLGPPGVRVIQEPVYAIEGGASTNEPVFVSSNRVYLPRQVLDYRSEQGPISLITVKILPKDTTFGHRIYAQPDGYAISCQVVLMGADRTSIHKPQYCLAGSGYMTIDTQPVTVRISRPHAYDLPVMKLKLRRTVTREGEARTEGAVFAYWFVADGELTSSHADRMWRIARDLLRTGVLQRWAYVICLAPCEPGREDEAFERMKSFIAASVPQFQLTAGAPESDMAAK